MLKERCSVMFEVIIGFVLQIVDMVKGIISMFAGDEE